VPIDAGVYGLMQKPQIFGPTFSKAWQLTPERH
jgi:hypothetical protein